MQSSPAVILSDTNTPTAMQAPEGTEATPQMTEPIVNPAETPETPTDPSPEPNLDLADQTPSHQDDHKQAEPSDNTAEPKHNGLRHTANTVRAPESTDTGSTANTTTAATTGSKSHGTGVSSNNRPADERKKTAIVDERDDPKAPLPECIEVDII